MHIVNLHQFKTEWYHGPWESFDREITLNDVQLMQFK